MNKLIKYFGYMPIKEHIEYKEQIDKEIINVLKESDKPTEIYYSSPFADMSEELMVHCNVIIISPAVSINTCSFVESTTVIASGGGFVNVSGCMFDGGFDDGEEPIISVSIPKTPEK